MDGAALLVVAVVPWLGPIFKAIEVTGVGRVEFQERLDRVEGSLSANEQRVEDLNARVDQVESVITGATPHEEAGLTAALHEYHQYLTSLGFSLDRPQPGIRVVDVAESRPPDMPNAFYVVSTDQIEIARPLVADRDVLFREYTHHLLPNLRAAGGLSIPEAEALESGLADYFPCSFKNRPEFDVQAAAVYRTWIPGFDRAALRRLVNGRSFSELADADRWDGGEVWGGALWEIRSLLGAEACDRLLAQAWPGAPSLEPVPFAQELAGEAGVGALARVSSDAERPAGVAGRSGRARGCWCQSPEASTAIWEDGSTWNRGSH